MPVLCQGPPLSSIGLAFPGYDPWAEVEYQNFAQMCSPAEGKVDNIQAYQPEVSGRMQTDIRIQRSKWDVQLLSTHTNAQRDQREYFAQAMI